MNREYLQQVAELIGAKLPDHHGFILLAVPFQGAGQRVTYVSSLKREDAILILKEWMIKASGEEDWMRHIK